MPDPLRQVDISGPYAADSVHFLTPRDLIRCSVGQCKHALITSAEGGIL